MAIQRDHPYGSFNFIVTLGGAPDALGGFTEVVLPEIAIDVIEYRSGGDPDGAVRKLPGRAHYSNAVLRRGLTGATDLYAWINDVRNGSHGSARTVLIQLQSEDRSQIVWTWKLLRAWPCHYRGTPLNAKGKDVVVEELELTFDRLEIE